jgi:outer membrane biosynthesis protein TonB
VPHLLAQLEDELARSRKREAFWISIIVHILFVLLIIFSPQLLPQWAQPHLVRPDDRTRTKAPTFLALPADEQKPPPKVESNKISDKNRIAQTRRPQLDRKAPEGLPTRGDMRAPGPPPAPQPIAPRPAMPEQAPQQAMMTPPPVASPGIQSGPPTLPQPVVKPQLALPQPKVQPQQAAGENPFKSGSAGSMIAKAVQGPRPHVSGQGGGGYGAGGLDHRMHAGSFDVLSDTEGVDIGPYLARLKPIVEMNMALLEPESARPPLMKHGQVVIRFTIMPDGKIIGMQLEAPSGDISLDRASWGSITASNPFPVFPSNFHLPYIILQAHMLWNPTYEDLQEATTH